MPRSFSCHRKASHARQRPRMATTAIEQAYFRLGNRRAPEDPRLHRQRFAVGLTARVGYDFSLLIRKLQNKSLQQRPA